MGVGASRTIVKILSSGQQETAPLRDVAETIALNATLSEPRTTMDMYAFEKDSNLFEEAPELIDAIKGTAASIFGDWFNDHDALRRVRSDSTHPLVPNNGAELPPQRGGDGDGDGGGHQPDRQWSYYFALGSESSGVHLHHHSDGWSYLFEGSLHVSVIAGATYWVVPNDPRPNNIARVLSS